MKETLFCMTKDIRAVLIYYPVAVMTGFIGMLVYAMICKRAEWSLPFCFLHML